MRENQQSRVRSPLQADSTCCERALVGARLRSELPPTIDPKHTMRVHHRSSVGSRSRRLRSSARIHCDRCRNHVSPCRFGRGPHLRWQRQQEERSTCHDLTVQLAGGNGRRPAVDASIRSAADHCRAGRSPLPLSRATPRNVPQDALRDEVRALSGRSRTRCRCSDAVSDRAVARSGADCQRASCARRISFTPCRGVCANRRARGHRTPWPSRLRTSAACSPAAR